MKFKAVLLDMDGTLIDTAPGVIACAKDVFRMMGLELPPEENFRRFIGPPLPECFRLTAGLDRETCLRAAEVYKKTFNKKYIELFRIYPGMREFLEGCRKRDILLGVATFKQPGPMNDTLRHFGIDSLFSCAVGQDPDSTRTKAQIIEMCAEELGIPCDRSILMVGDSQYDFDGAEDAGVSFAAAAYGYGFAGRSDVPGLTAAENVGGLSRFVFDS
ncbi:MAG: HAD family hydrolase [Oscillospiraceae bacterium]|jgi:phosphoglycolate phosphatase